jgi:hypothetical protein
VKGVEYSVKWFAALRAQPSFIKIARAGSENSLICEELIECLVDGNSVMAEFWWLLAQVPNPVARVVSERC